ncbi:hypothetical protein BGM19_06970 [Streptomyces agglomeratus]|uniref:hypothetical protein n=1 Tax=Streptomyces agglomeratus TaxID=285458 RepID=UPI00086A9760|nr:hypothetical protein [Streptomyces agglomeratus]OEJ57747.1 hypothetical protein BGM19_06970 [Streptomyces agglomeratus]
MNRNAKKGRLDPGPSQESFFAAGDKLAATVTLIARPVVVVTAGRIEYAARCPHCQDWHRHISLGEKTGPCGARYLLQPKAKLRGAA